MTNHAWIRKSAVGLICVPTLLFVLGGCSLNRMATRMTADALTSQESSSVFASDEDPELIADALPFGLKTYEALLAQLPEHEGLLQASAEGFVSYAHGFILGPSERLGYDEREKKRAMRARARKMFLRGRDYALHLLELRHPGFREALRIEPAGGGEATKSGDLREALLVTDEEDVEALYWAAAGWMGAVSASGLDISMLMEISKPVVLMTRAFELEPDYDDGAIHSFFIQVYGSVPSTAMLYGTDEAGAYAKDVMEDYYRRQLGRVPEDPEESARHHLDRAISLSDGELAGPYLAFASSFSVRNQDLEEYERLLEKALAVDPDARPESRLLNTLDQRRAEWMYEHIEDKFITYSE